MTTIVLLVFNIYFVGALRSLVYCLGLRYSWNFVGLMKERFNGRW